MAVDPISNLLFQPFSHKIGEDEAIVRPSTTYWQDVWYRLKQNKGAIAGLVIVLIMIVMAIVGPYLTPYSYDTQNLTAEYTNQPPSSAHWFGTDDLGRDLFTRVWHGARVSLLIGFLSALVQFVIGVTYGGISGYIGGWVDEVMMRIVEILSGIPFLLYVILLMVILEPGLKTILIALGVVYWLSMARLVRGQVLALKEQEYVLAARALGASQWRIIFRHLIPNCMGPILVYSTLAIPEAIFAEAWLSFLGLGVSAPAASLGMLVSDGIGAIRLYPYQLFFPAFFISLTILAFNILGDGLRDALDPRLRK
ncbi:MAG: ABC transporter permease [Thermacetogeniaceae bacterium]|jgi:oligopeptide transport system permease protein|nr:ABC transporter permease [Syntrophomonadaceae bacterium]